MRKSARLIGAALILLGAAVIVIELALEARVQIGFSSLSTGPYDGTPVHEINFHLVEARYGLGSYIGEHMTARLPFEVRY